jgi:hypothetical protein
MTAHSVLHTESSEATTDSESTTDPKAARGPSAMREGGMGTAVSAPWGRDRREAAEFGMIGILNPPDGVREGMRSVALELPASSNNVSTGRDLVTNEHPFRPRLFYFTDGALFVAAVGWLASALGLLFMHRARFRWLRDRLRSSYDGRMGRGEIQIDPKEPSFTG